MNWLSLVVNQVGTIFASARNQALIFYFLFASSTACDFAILLFRHSSYDMVPWSWKCSISPGSRPTKRARQFLGDTPDPGMTRCKVEGKKLLQRSERQSAILTTNIGSSGTIDGNVTFVHSWFWSSVGEDLRCKTAEFPPSKSNTVMTPTSVCAATRGWICRFFCVFLCRVPFRYPNSVRIDVWFRLSFLVIACNDDDASCSLSGFACCCSMRIPWQIAWTMEWDALHIPS